MGWTAALWQVSEIEGLISPKERKFQKCFNKSNVIHQWKAYVEQIAYRSVSEIAKAPLQSKMRLNLHVKIIY